MNFNSNYELKLKSMKKLIYLGLLAICLSINYAANASQHFLGDSNFSTSYSVANLKIKRIEFNDVSNNELRKMLNLASKKELQSKHLKDFPLDISYSYEGHDVMNYERFNGLNLTYESLDQPERRNKNFFGHLLYGALLGVLTAAIDQASDHPAGYQALDYGTGALYGAGCGLLVYIIF